MQNLKQAAQHHSFTQVEQYLSEISALGEAERRFAEHLGQLLSNYQIHQILDILKEIDS